MIYSRFKKNSLNYIFTHTHPHTTHTSKNENSQYKEFNFIQLKKVDKSSHLTAEEKKITKNFLIHIDKPLIPRGARFNDSSL